MAHAEAEFDKALRLSPNSADLLSIYAAWASSYGKPEKGVEAALRAIRLNPQPPAYAFRTYRYTFFMAGRYDDALHFANRVPREACSSFDHVLRAAALAALGRGEEARAAVAETIAQFPDISAEGFAILDPVWNESERQRLVETMRKAGFPLCASADDFRNSPDLQRLPECVGS
ncbi:tetratricopeptide repeat protein [Geminicoccus harenae]|uniref:tetratricopeptide repeat protein n=1 Tax=Geminicoccus harenae TaxID=2498453 RepID=UPI00168B3633|nr:tetratricopeptide repeat protein [Geminicoccus harenae]